MVKTLFRLLLATTAALGPWVQADPTRPPGWGVAPAVSESARPLQLQQITRYGSQASAVINNQLVAVGDSVDGARVMAIQTDRVVLQQRGQRRELTLFNRADVKRNTP